MTQARFSKIRREMRKLQPADVSGRVLSVGGLGLRACGLGESAKIGDRACVAGKIAAEVVATDPSGVSLLPFGVWDGIGRGDQVQLSPEGAEIYPDRRWIGRVVDAFGEPMDDYDLPDGARAYPLRAGAAQCL